MFWLKSFENEPDTELFNEYVCGNFFSVSVRSLVLDVCIFCSIVEAPMIIEPFRFDIDVLLFLIYNRLLVPVQNLLTFY